eukprot:gnl/MRDRNA2_/MRDRNA2_90751_c0_seq1.p1 gnl/MRDRNA2_/MRDRNA2_90751_c0~~gnl/MRDRNA2_/MRDRNA2_90751_c0_seq1.p1  ORF type:complete len:416 (-),score=71.46 gnl/MRDRNA2_/MRDRNA2_90751_c0_seq1:113-1360(-)
MRRSQSDPSLGSNRSGSGAEVPTLRPCRKRPPSEWQPELVSALNSRYTRPRSVLNVDRNWFSERMTDFGKLAVDTRVTIDSPHAREQLKENFTNNFKVRWDCEINGVKLAQGLELVQDSEFRNQFGFGIDTLITTRDIIYAKLPFSLKFRGFDHAETFIIPRVAKQGCKDPMFEKWRRCEAEAFDDASREQFGNKSQWDQKRDKKFARMRQIWERAYKAPHMIWFLRSLSQALKTKIEQRSGIRKELLFAKPGTTGVETNMFMTDSLRRTQSKAEVAQSVFNFTKRDFHEVLMCSGITALTRHQMNLLFDCFDSNSNGVICVQELYYATEHLAQESERKLAQIVHKDRKEGNERAYCLETPRLQEIEDAEDVYQIMQNAGKGDLEVTHKPVEAQNGKATLRPDPELADGMSETKK